MTSLKILQRQVSFYAKAGEVNTSPPIGPMLSQHGIDVKQFCVMFNNETQIFEKGVLLKVIMNIYKNNTFSYIIKSSPLFFLFELSSFKMELQNLYLNEKAINLISIYIILLILNIEYKLKNLKKLLKFLIKNAKKNDYKIIETSCEYYYYIYI